MSTQHKLERLALQINDSVLLRRTLMERCGTQILETANVMAGVIGSGGKILLAGNGEQAAAASHFAAQLVVRLSADRTRQSLPAISLCVDPSVMTAAANDLGFAEVFVRQLDGLGHRGDMLIILGNSVDAANLLRAAQTARERGILTLGILGGNGGRLATLVDRTILIPHPSPQRVIEEQIFLIHMLVELIESDLFT